MKRRFVLDIVALFLGLALTMTLSEVLLRACGFQPWRYNNTDAHEPTMHEPDPILGWQNKRGSYTIPPYHPSGQTTHVTFLENGRRRTAVNSSLNSVGELVLIGDSFTQGWAISDSETYAWKLQEKFPFLHVLNYGTGGYGTYQSLLMLERELPRLANPKFVLYGFLPDHHEIRNAASGSWLATLSSYSRRSHIDVPFATFDEKNSMVRHPPERYVSLPFRESSALIAFIEKSYMFLKTRDRFLKKRLTTEQLLLQMNRVSVENNATFATVILYADEQTKQHYMKFLGENHIQVIDCAYDVTDELIVPGEGHPNGQMNTLWANCISDRLKDQFEDSRLTNQARLTSSDRPGEMTGVTAGRKGQ